MIRNVVVLTINDLAIAFKNKTLYLILFIPLFIFVSLTLVDRPESEIQGINIGLLENHSYPPALITSLQSASRLFTISWLADEAQGRQWLEEKSGDGMLIPSDNTVDCCTLVVLAKASFETVAIADGIAALQRAAEGGSSSWIAEIRPIQEFGLQRQMMPTWILMLVLLVGFIILPAQVAEEKEKKLLLGLLQTPIREEEWLLAKIAYGMILFGVAALFLHCLTRIKIDNGDALFYLGFLLVGGFSFSSFGVLVGLLCRTQASARTLGVLIYLPNLLPSALSDFSKSLNSVAPWLPAYQFYQPLKAILLQGRGTGGYVWELLALFAFGCVTLLVSYRLIKQRWLM
ncbi:MAG: ABC transporter permease [Halioglobus sp.]